MSIRWRWIGYLYIILQGETFNQLAADAWQKTLWSIVLWTLLLVTRMGLRRAGRQGFDGTDAVPIVRRHLGGELADRPADSDRQRREFVANISHDLRTPLTSLLGYLETLTPPRYRDGAPACGPPGF
jgi:signal transduction histidine kinase